MKLSTIKEIKYLVGNDYRNIIEGMNNSTPDMYSEDDNYRFIHQDYIDDIMVEELESDLYILGCFNADFISSILNIDQEVIEAMQQAEAFEAIGKLIISLGKLSELQIDYVHYDGYGHHFAHYDGEENIINDYYVFRVN